jgi:hypothetical protein
MGTRSGEAKERDLTERQRAWLKHVRAAESRGEALTDDAKRRGLSVGSLCEAKRRLRQVGVIPAAKVEDATKARAARSLRDRVLMRPAERVRVHLCREPVAFRKAINKWS